MQKNIAHFFKPCGKFQALVVDNSIESQTSESRQTSSSTFTETIGPQSSAMSHEQNATPFHPVEHFSFQNFKIGRQNKSCQYQWFRQYLWLEYDIRNYPVCCFYCKNQNNQSNIQAEHW